MALFRQLFRQFLAPWPWLLLMLALAGCGDRPQLPRLGEGDVVLAFGDSLTHGTGAGPEDAYPAQLEQRIARQVVNAGVPGETTAEALERLPQVLAEASPRLMLLCLGGNDLLRRLNPAQTEANLAAMVDMARSRGVAVVLIGVPEPALLGGAAPLYGQLAERLDLPYEGEILNAVLKDPSLKSDPVHPNARGYARVAERLAEFLAENGAL